MAFNYNTGNEAAVVSLLKENNPMQALGQKMSELDTMLDTRASKEYSNRFLNEINQAKSSADILSKSTDWNMLTPEAQLYRQSMLDRLTGQEASATKRQQELYDKEVARNQALEDKGLQAVLDYDKREDEQAFKAEQADKKLNFEKQQYIGEQMMKSDEATIQSVIKNAENAGLETTLAGVVAPNALIDFKAIISNSKDKAFQRKPNENDIQYNNRINRYAALFVTKAMEKQSDIGTLLGFLEGDIGDVEGGIKSVRKDLENLHTKIQNKVNVTEKPNNKELNLINPVDVMATKPSASSPLDLLKNFSQ